MKLFVTIGLALSLCACSQANGSEEKSSQPVVAEPSEDVAMSVEPTGDIGDGVDRPMLQMMSYQEFSGAIEAGMGCSFVANENDDPIFVATAEDSASSKGRAAIKLNDQVVVLTHEGTGIAQVEKGGLFASEAVEVTIAHPETEPTSNAEATYYWEATLIIAQDEVGSNSYEGKYECGA
ncbi:MAG: hypothetical protein Pars2KO_22730 [Parasphingorhabdus sp.]